MHAYVVAELAIQLTVCSFIKRFCLTNGYIMQYNNIYSKNFKVNQKINSKIPNLI